MCREKDETLIRDNRLLERNKQGIIRWVWIRRGGGGLMGMRRVAREEVEGTRRRGRGR